MRCLNCIVLAVFYLIFILKVSAEAVFELQLDNFVNHFGRDINGECCSGYKNSQNKCSGACLLKFRVCLNVYQKVINPASPCTFGEEVTPILGENSVDFSKVKDFANPVSFQLDSWQGTFSLIVEAYHENNHSTSYTAESIGPVLVTRLMTQNSLSIATKWTVGEDRTSHALLRYKYRVLCQDHYHGEGCRKWCRPRDDSFGHYNCNAEGDRVCLPGWTDAGSYCNTAVCSPGCKGFCTKPNECVCHPGWQGPRCDQCKLYPSCQHGTCDEPFTCNCNVGWGGLFCDLDLNYCTNNKPCKNGATCFNASPGSYSCQCPPGYNGTNCEILNDSCANTPCRNGGTCLDTGNDGFVCQCPTGHTGRYCELFGQTCADRPCLNGSPCADTASGFECHCRPGYEGLTCERAVNDCLSDPCMNGGSCVDEHDGFKCVCQVGYTGPRCSINKNDCTLMSCFNGGICIDGLNSFRCQCKPGFAGSFCETNVNDCAVNPCANGGTCIDAVNSFQCSCRQGWAGPKCDKLVLLPSPCESNPCLSGGLCKAAPELSSGYRCSCPPGLFGPRCSVPQKSLIVSSEEELSEPMSTLQLVLIISFSVAVPALVGAFVVAIICMKRKRRREMNQHDEEARRQNEQNMVHNAVNNKNLATKMIFNSLDYPCKPINTDQAAAHQSYQPIVHRSNVKGGGGGDLCTAEYHPPSKTLENTYTIIPTRSTKTLNTDASRLSLASRLEKDLDAYTLSRNSPLNISKTPDPQLPRTHSQSDVFLKRGPGSGNCSTSGKSDTHCVSTHTLSSTYTPSTCTTPSSAVYVIEEHYNDDNFIATEV